MKQGYVNAVIRVQVPKWQIGEEVQVSFPDTMCVKGKCEENKKDKCSTCKHYDADYGDTCLNPSGTCRVFEYDGYEPKGDKEC